MARICIDIKDEEEKTPTQGFAISSWKKCADSYYLYREVLNFPTF
jgi:hypothetical protein